MTYTTLVAWTVIPLGLGGSVPTKLTGVRGPVYPIQNTKTKPCA